MSFATFTKIYTDSNFTPPAGVRYLTISAYSYVKATQLVNSTAYLDTSGAVYTMGNNQDGLLGDGNPGLPSNSRSTPLLISGNNSFIALDNQGSTNIYCLNNVGQVYSWGQNINGSLGVNDVVPRSTPTLVVGGLYFREMVGTGIGAAALTLNGQLYTWGQNANGQLGDSTVVNKSSPVAVLGGLLFKKVVGDKYTGNYIGITTTGATYSWGFNPNGQIGDGTVIPKSSPVLVTGGLSFVDIYTMGNSSVYGITTAGDAYAWGLNTSGQLGVGDVNPRSSPTLIQGGLKWRSIIPSFGSSFASCLGLTTSGALYAWGINQSGQLGDGTVVPKSSPVLVSGGLTFRKAFASGGAVGDFCTMSGITENGNLYGWGFNGGGQIGDNTTTSRSSPVLVTGGFTWLDYQTSYLGNVFAVRDNGAVYTWGRNQSGQLGTNDVVWRSSPTLLAIPQLYAAAPTITTTIVSVVPGTSYAISLRNYFATFGNQPIGTLVDQITISYDL